MEDGNAQVLVAREVLDAFPFLAMIINEDYEVVVANTWLAKSLDEPAGGCPFACYEAVHGADEPRPDCPLAESIRTNVPVERELVVGEGCALQIVIYPLRVGDPQGRKLFLDLMKSV